MEKNIKPAATAKEAPIASQPAAQATINPAIDKANYIIQITDGETVIQQLLAANSTVRILLLGDQPAIAVLK